MGWQAGVREVMVLMWLVQSMAPGADAFAYELTFELKEWQQECFYQPILRTNVVLEIEYQVLEGGRREVAFTLKGPNSRNMMMENERRQGSHQIQIDEPGNYEVCFDNRHDSFYKVIFFELYTEFDDDSFTSAIRQDQKSAAVEAAEEIMDMTVDQIKIALSTVQRHTEKIRSLQSLVTSYMIRDRHIAEEVYTRVNIFSGGYLLVMFTVGLVQVIMIRSLFNAADTHKMKMST